jgi:hypothetical protein
MVLLCCLNLLLVMTYILCSSILLGVERMLMTKRGGDDLTRPGENKRACCSGEEENESPILGLLLIPLYRSIHFTVIFEHLQLYCLMCCLSR